MKGSPSKGIEEGVEEGGDFAPNKGVILPRHIDDSLKMFLFLEFEPQLGKSENRAFKVLFTTKKQTAFAWNCLEKPQYKSHRGVSILYFK